MTYTAWDLVGFDGEFRVKGGRVVWESIDYNESITRPNRREHVLLQRLDTSRGYLRCMKRYVPADTEIEVISGAVPGSEGW